MAVGMVVDQARAEPDHALEAEVARSRASISSRVSRVAVGVEQALLGGERRCPMPSPSIAPPSRIQSALAKGRPARLGEPLADVRRRRRSSYLPPQPLKPKPCARRALPAAEHDRPGVAQPDVAERLDDHLGERRQLARALGGAVMRPRPATPVSPLPPAWTASAKAATSRSAGFEIAEPQLGIARKADPHRFVRRPFGKGRRRHRPRAYPTGR